MASATEQSNEKHLAPWSAACQGDGISNTPLTPYLDQELLYNKHLHVDGRKIEATGFQYEVPCVTLDLLKEVSVVQTPPGTHDSPSLLQVVQDYIQSGLFPTSLLPGAAK